MQYTVKKLAQLSGVSIRTLRFYDEIDLLKPAFYGENKYRYYEEEQLLMLQQILFFRELGFSLSDIQRILGGNDFDKIESLKSQKFMLKAGLERTENTLWVKALFRKRRWIKVGPKYKIGISLTGTGSKPKATPFIRTCLRPC
jgi:DNA-binding transcriptional MerR regulator